MPRHLSNGIERMQRLQYTAPDAVSPRKGRHGPKVTEQSDERSCSSDIKEVFSENIEEQKAPAGEELPAASEAVESFSVPARRTISGKSRSQLGGAVVRRTTKIEPSQAALVEALKDEPETVEATERVPSQAGNAAGIEDSEAAAAEIKEPKVVSEPIPEPEPQKAEAEPSAPTVRRSGLTRKELGGQAVRRRSAVKQIPTDEETGLPEAENTAATEVTAEPAAEIRVTEENAGSVRPESPEADEAVEEIKDAAGAETEDAEKDEAETEEAEFEQIGEDDAASEENDEIARWFRRVKAVMYEFGTRVNERVQSGKAEPREETDKPAEEVPTEEAAIGSRERVFEEVPSKPEEWDAIDDESGEFEEKLEPETLEPEAQEPEAQETETLEPEAQEPEAEQARTEIPPDDDVKIADTRDWAVSRKGTALENFEESNGATQRFRMSSQGEPEMEDVSQISGEPETEEPSQDPEEPAELLSRRERRKKAEKGTGFRNIFIAIGAAILLVIGLYMCKVAQDRQGLMGETEKPGATEEAETAETSEYVETEETGEITETESEQEGQDETVETGETVEEEGRSLIGDWLSEPDEETYAEVLRISSEEIAVFSTMVESEDTLTGWITGEWYTAEVGKAVPALTGNILTFTLQDEDETLNYRYEIAWITDDCFMAQVYCNEEAIALYTFNRVIQ